MKTLKRFELFKVIFLYKSKNGGYTKEALQSLKVDCTDTSLPDGWKEYFTCENKILTLNCKHYITEGRLYREFYSKNCFTRWSPNKGWKSFLCLDTHGVKVSDVTKFMMIMRDSPIDKNLIEFEKNKYCPKWFREVYYRKWKKKRYGNNEKTDNK